MLRRLTRQSRMSLRKKVPGHSATLLVVTGCAMSVGELYPSVGDAPDSSSTGALRCVGEAPMTRRHPRLLRRRRVSLLVATPTALRYTCLLPSSRAWQKPPPHMGSPCGTLSFAYRDARCALVGQAPHWPPSYFCAQVRREKCSILRVSLS